MDFKKLYPKYLAGECSDEEREFVEAEIERARVVSEEMFKGQSNVELKPAGDEDVLKAKKKLNVRTFIKTVVISIISCLVLAGIGIAVILGLAISGAKSNLNYDEMQAEQIAKEYVYSYAKENSYGDGSNSPFISEQDKDLQFKSPLSRSYYIYEYEIQNGEYEFEIEFNSQTGECVITDVDTK